MRYENNERTNAIRVNGRYPLIMKVDGRPISKMRKADRGLVYEDSFIKAVPFNKLVNNTDGILTGLNQNPPRYNNQEMKQPIVASSRLVWQRLPDSFNFKYTINSYQVFHRYRSGMRKAWEHSFSSEANNDNTLGYRKETKENVVYGFRKWRDKDYTDNTNTNYHKTHFNAIVLNPDFQNTKRLRLLNFPYRIDYSAGTHNEIYPFILKGFVTREPDIHSNRRHILYSVDMHYGINGIFNNTYSNESPYQIQYFLKLSANPMNDEDIERTDTWTPIFIERNVHRSDNALIARYSHDRYSSTRISSGVRTDIPSNLRPSITMLKNYINIYDYFISTYGSVRYVELGENVLKTKTIGPNNNQFALPNNSELIDIIDRNNYQYGAIKLEISNQYGRAAYYFKMDIDKNGTVRWEREDTGRVHNQDTTSRSDGNITERITTVRTMDTAEYKYVNNVKTNIIRNPGSREISRSVAEWRLKRETIRRINYNNEYYLDEIWEKEEYYRDNRLTSDTRNRRKISETKNYRLLSEMNYSFIQNGDSYTGTKSIDSNGYGGMSEDLSRRMNSILGEVPDGNIVIDKPLNLTINMTNYLKGTDHQTLWKISGNNSRNTVIIVDAPIHIIMNEHDSSEILFTLITGETSQPSNIKLYLTERASLKVSIKNGPDNISWIDNSQNIPIDYYFAIVKLDNKWNRAKAWCAFMKGLSDRPTKATYSIHRVSRV